MSDEGISISWEDAALKSGSRSLRWRDVQRIVVYKEDIFAYDLICMQFDLADGEFLRVHEHMNHWEEIATVVSERFPEAVAPEVWFDQVMLPPFAPCLTEVWSREWRKGEVVPDES